MYNIVLDVNYKNFIVKCNEKMEEGWEPIGGLSVFSNELAQSFIKSKVLFKVAPDEIALWLDF